jgi:STE24 endopeptidase
VWVYPSLIAPLFNRFTPLEDGPLKTRIMEIAKRIGFGISDIYIMDGSKRSSHSNAYFTGFGKNRRIVLFDTLIRSLSTPQLIGVLAHEMGHNKLHHIRTNILLSLSLSFAGFYLWSHLIDYPPFYRAFGLSGENLFPALVLFPLVMGPLSFFLSPLMNILSRRHEYESDAFAAEATHRPDDLAEALEILNKENLSNLNPHPFFSFFYYSHPTLDERLGALENLKRALSSGEKRQR